METLLLTPENIQHVVGIAAQTLKGGGVIIAPTDTVYGMIADATNESAITKLFEIKNRPTNKSLPIFVQSIEVAKTWAIISPEQELYLKKNWPGKVTVILERNKDTTIFGVEEKTVALRIPSYSFINLLLKAVKLPLSGTSANISGKPASTKIDEILQQFADEKILPDLIISAGDLPESQPSIIVDLTQAEIKVIRP
ncbi:MAG: L-threonylcarbamoyladenylate synthase [Candidatus Parcubacteria bacterium]|nr:L-threonylcarbamoyladenylate synthase [Candidatus Parcubacteria bacterium]